MVSSSLTASRSRSLLRDFSDCLAQEMIWWGCDARHSAGNLLVAFGMQRIERASAHGEGSSRYRMNWQGGVIELHGFCAGWYPAAEEESGFLYIRNRRRLLSTLGGRPQVPGAYDSVRMGHLSPDELLTSVMPFVSWLIAYEEWIRDSQPTEYREMCWREARRLSRGWLAPQDALRWLRDFERDPGNAARARTKTRRMKTASPPNRRQFAYS